MLTLDSNTLPHPLAARTTQVLMQCIVQVKAISTWHAPLCMAQQYHALPDWREQHAVTWQPSALLSGHKGARQLHYSREQG